MLKAYVTEMTCGHCVHKVSDAVRNTDPDATLDINLATRTTAARTAMDEKHLPQVFSSAGSSIQDLILSASFDQSDLRRPSLASHGKAGFALIPL
jgi:copper chaperone CopZ